MANEENVTIGQMYRMTQPIFYNPEPKKIIIVRQWLCDGCHVIWETYNGEWPDECDRCECATFHEKSIKGN